MTHAAETFDLMLTVPGNVIYVINKLENAGYEAFLVGGCVRDFLMGRKPKDFDVTTSATTDEMQVVFAGDRVIETGLRHGTLTVLSNGEPIEVTTYRIDGEYSDHRHPDRVTFTRNLEEDLKRRDFTVNAMAYSPSRGLVDLFGGKEDVEAGIIRAVGNPELRFSEDALRILRGLRFAARYGFCIEENTFRAMISLAGTLKDVSEERIYKELLGILSADGDGIKDILIKAKEIIFSVIPELRPTDGCPQRTRYHLYDVWTHTSIATASVRNDPVLRLTLLLHDVSKPAVMKVLEDGRTSFKGHDSAGAKTADAVLRRLKAPTKTRETVVKYIEYHEYFKITEINSYAAGKFIAKLGSIEDAENMLEIFRADMAGKAELAASVNGPAIDKLAEEIYNYKIEGKCFRITDLKLGGDDLIALGVPAGREVGVILNELLNLVMAGALENETESESLYVKSRLAQTNKY